jgi:hypothetical protein
MAAGDAQPVDAALAADGIDEVFVIVKAWGAPPDGSERPLHLHGTGRGDEWIHRDDVAGASMFVASTALVT